MLHYNVLFHVNHLGCLARRFSLSPTNLHCSQTFLPVCPQFRVFVSPTNLHYSQTKPWCDCEGNAFVSPTNLHCSQTIAATTGFTALFVSPTNLHCSQTVFVTTCFLQSLFPLRIYTALKPRTSQKYQITVCFPYEFTLLSNRKEAIMVADEVCFPYEFTLLSNLKFV